MGAVGGWSMLGLMIRCGFVGFCRGVRIRFASVEVLLVYGCCHTFWIFLSFRRLRVEAGMTVRRLDSWG